MNTSRRVRITMRTRLSPRLSQAFDGMTVESSPTGSRLVGVVSDQAQLHGVLTRIRDLGLELESITTSPAERDGDASEAAEAPPGSADSSPEPSR